MSILNSHRFSSSTGWTPAVLEGSGLYAWYDASDLTDSSKADVTGTDVNKWYNQSSIGSDLDFTIPSANNPQVTTSHKIGGLDAIEFDNKNFSPTWINMAILNGEGQSFLGPVNTLIQDFYIFFVVKTIERTNIGSSALRHIGAGNTLNSNTYFNSHLPWTNGSWVLDLTDKTGAGGYRISTPGNLINDGDIWIGTFENSHPKNTKRLRVNGTDEASNSNVVSSFRGNGYIDSTVGNIPSTHTWTPEMNGTFIDSGTIHNSQPLYIMYDGNGAGGNNWYMWWDTSNWKITDEEPGTTPAVDATGGTNSADPTDNGGSSWTNVTGFTATGSIAARDSTAVYAQLGVNTYTAFGELLTVSGESLSDADIQKVEGYLAHKWGQVGSLPAGHPYKTVAP